MQNSPRNLPQKLIENSTVCQRCGGRNFRDVKIHGGKSLRRDCKTCHRTTGFPLWYGERDFSFSSVEEIESKNTADNWGETDAEIDDENAAENSPQEYAENPDAIPCICGSNFYWTNLSGSRFCVGCCEPPTLSVVANVFAAVKIDGKNYFRDVTEIVLPPLRKVAAENFKQQLIKNGARKRKAENAAAIKDDF